MIVLKDILDAGGESADGALLPRRMLHPHGKARGCRAVFQAAPSRSIPVSSGAKEKLAHIMIGKGAYEEAEKILDPPETDFADLIKILGDIKFYRAISPRRNGSTREPRRERGVQRGGSLARP